MMDLNPFAMCCRGFLARASPSKFNYISKLFKNIFKNMKLIKHDDGGTLFMSYNFTLEILMTKNAPGSTSQ